MKGNPTIASQRAGISSARSAAPGGALVRDVPPIEEPAESAAKESQCVRYHRSKEREESASIASIAREPGRFGGSPEQRGLQVNVSFKHFVFVLVWKNDFPRAGCSLGDSRISGNPLAHA